MYFRTRDFKRHSMDPKQMSCQNNVVSTEHEPIVKYICALEFTGSSKQPPVLSSLLFHVKKLSQIQWLFEKQISQNWQLTSPNKSFKMSPVFYMWFKQIAKIHYFFLFSYFSDSQIWLYQLMMIAPSAKAQNIEKKALVLSATQSIF